MQFRMADESDATSIIKVRFDYFSAENWSVSEENRVLIESQLKKYYKKHLNIDFFAGIAETDSGEIASTAFLAIFEKPANLSYPTGKTGTVLNVLTYPEYRRKGYATKVLNLLIEKARQQDLSYIDLSASSSGKPLYEKLGFKGIRQGLFTEMKLTLI